MLAESGSVEIPENSATSVDNTINEDILNIPKSEKSTNVQSIEYEIDCDRDPVLHQVLCASDDIEGYRNRYLSYPRPSRPSPGDRQFGENYGWMYHPGEGYWYHPQSMWRWRPNNGGLRKRHRLSKCVGGVLVIINSPEIYEQ
ncbi:hypothetical protein QTP88_015666 [Uroleucon formosanum]